jgi:glycine/D-amino acid oxidase-like deaminating enzyme
MATIDEVVRDHAIDAHLEWVDGFLHAPLKGDSNDEASRLKQDAALARELGFDAEYLDAVPIAKRPGIRFANQARFHPRAYLAGVAKALVALGGRIYEHSEAD